MRLDHDGLGEELFAAANTASPVALLTDRYPDLTWEDARRIARATDELRLQSGDLLLGYKLGWTSRAMREALGVDRPNWGTLWESQVVNGELKFDALIHPKAEPELVYRHREDGPGEWALGIEVVDPRFPSFNFDALDNTADNSSSARIAVGEFQLLKSPELLQVQFTDGIQRYPGIGSNAMDSPALAVEWFVEQLAAEGGSLKAGEIVFTGGLTAPFDVNVDRTYLLTGSPLSAVSFAATQS